jgi:hypothetical protein
VGRAPIEHEVFVEPGARTIEAKLVGYDDATQTLEAGAGSAQVVTLALSASAAKVAPAASASPSSAPSAPLIKEEPPPPRRPLWPIAVGGGATAVFLAGGIAFTVVASGHRADSREFQKQIDALGKRCGAGADKATCGALKNALMKTDNSRNLALAGFIGAGVTALATATYLLWPVPKAAGRGLRVVPSISQSSAGIAFAGAF